MQRGDKRTMTALKRDRAGMGIYDHIRIENLLIYKETLCKTGNDAGSHRHEDMKGRTS